MGMKLAHPDGVIDVEAVSGGKSKVSVHCSNSAVFVPVTTCETSYSLEMIEQILAVKGIGFLCDEILRDESPSYVQEPIRCSILAYLSEEAFIGKTILDFGCGSGASTMALCKLFPQATIIGVDLERELLNIARLRKQHWGFTQTQFLPSPSAESLPEGLGPVDFVVIFAVYEHLLPHERRLLLPKLWGLLKPGGVLFLNGTPHRYSPIEGHTTGFPLINYLPDKLTYSLVNKWCRRVPASDTWENLLRRGIRGGTVHEILKILWCVGRPVLLQPHRLGMKDRIDLWMPRAHRAAVINLCCKCAAKVLQAITNITLCALP